MRRSKNGFRNARRVARGRICRPAANESDQWDRRLLRPRRERPGGRCAAKEREELAPLHSLMPPVLPSERIAHLGTADCCIHPPGRYEMIAITPPKIFSKEVAQNRPPHLPRQQPHSPPKNRFTPNFRGWGLDENLKPKSPPYRGAHYRGSAARQNEVGLAARAAASCRAPAPAPPSCIAITMRSMQPFFPLRLCRKSV
jgi:hypothetical protein